MAAFTVLDFQKTIQGGVRPNLFQVEFKFPSGVDKPVASDIVPQLCKSAALPASTVGTVELPFRGRVIKVPGDRTFESWTATFYNDQAWELRKAFEQWVDLTNQKDRNSGISPVNSGGDASVMQDITVKQYDKFNSATTLVELASYKLVAAFPVSVSQIAVAYDNNDSYEEFDVEFAYQYFETGYDK